MSKTVKNIKMSFMWTYCQKTRNKQKKPMGLHAPIFVHVQQGLIEFLNFRVEDMSNAVYISQPVIIFSCKWLLHFSRQTQQIIKGFIWEEKQAWCFFFFRWKGYNKFMRPHIQL